MKLFLLIMYVIMILIYYKQFYDNNKLTKQYNTLVKLYEDEKKQRIYYQKLFNETLKHKRILEDFVNTKITPNIENEQDRHI